MQEPHASVVALTAEKGAGKGLFVKLLKELLPNKRVVSMKFSDPLREILAILNLPISRANIGTLVTSLRAAFQHDGILNSAIKQYINTAQTDLIILDGVRKPEEVPLIREFNGILVYITAHQRTRHERRKVDPENADEMGMTFERFVELDSAPPEIAIRTIGEAMADVAIDNSGTVEEFRVKIKKFISSHNLIK